MLKAVIRTADWVRQTERVLEEMNEGVAVVDDQLPMVFANEALLRLGQYERDDAPYSHFSTPHRSRVRAGMTIVRRHSVILSSRSRWRPRPFFGGHLTVAAGPTFIFPTASDHLLGQHTWQLGPDVGVVWSGKHFIAYAFPQQWFKVGGGGKGAGIGSVIGGAGGLGTTAFHGRQKITLSSGQEMLIRITRR